MLWQIVVWRSDNSKCWEMVPIMFLTLQNMDKVVPKFQHPPGKMFNFDLVEWNSEMEIPDWTTIFPGPLILLFKQN